MVFFKPDIITNGIDPYLRQSNKYTLLKASTEKINNQTYSERIYKSKPYFVLWRIANICLLIFSYLSVYPVIKNKYGVKIIRQQIKTCCEIKIVLIAKKELKVEKPNFDREISHAPRKLRQLRTASFSENLNNLQLSSSSTTTLAPLKLKATPKKGILKKTTYPAPDIVLKVTAATFKSSSPWNKKCLDYDKNDQEAVAVHNFHVKASAKMLGDINQNWAEHLNALNPLIRNRNKECKFNGLADEKERYKILTDEKIKENEDLFGEMKFFESEIEPIPEWSAYVECEKMYATACESNNDWLPTKDDIVPAEFLDMMFIKDPEWIDLLECFYKEKEMPQWFEEWLPTKDKIVPAEFLHDMAEKDPEWIDLLQEAFKEKRISKPQWFEEWKQKEALKENSKAESVANDSDSEVEEVTDSETDESDEENGPESSSDLARTQEIITVKAQTEEVSKENSDNEGDKTVTISKPNNQTKANKPPRQKKTIDTRRNVSF